MLHYLYSLLVGQQVFTQDRVEELLADIRAFNAGAIDKALDKHIDTVYANWLNK